MQLLRIPDGLTVRRVEILRAAMADIGVREEKGYANRGRLDDNGRGVDRYQAKWLIAAGYKPCPKHAWCCAAVCTWWRDALGYHPYGVLERSVDKLQDRAQAVGRYRRTHPVPADALIILNGADNDDTITKGHTGLVVWSEPLTTFTGSILTIEGNSNNSVRVCRRSYDLAVEKAGTIHGFASPFPFEDDPSGFETGRGPVEGASASGTTR